MVSESRRAAIRRHYRLLRAAVDKTQIQVEGLARLDAGKFWKIENGVVFPTDEERGRIARVLKVAPQEIPVDEADSKAAVA